MPTAPLQRVNLWLFAFMCLIWGLTWIPIRIGATAVPPMVFAAARGLAGGTILLALWWWRNGADRIAGRDLPRLLAVGLLAFAAAYGLLFWGATKVDTAVVAVTNLSLIPVFLLVFGALMGEEVFHVRKLRSIALGVAGLGLLYASDIHSSGSGESGLGIAAVVAATVCFCFGTILSRELLRRYSPLLVASGTLLSGAAALIVVTSVVAPRSLIAAAEIRRPEVALSLAFLVIFASVIAYTSYLRLTRDWAPSRAGYYAFVSPAVAVLAGVWLMDEHLGARELLGMGLMLSGTVIALRDGRHS